MSWDQNIFSKENSQTIFEYVRALSSKMTLVGFELGRIRVYWIEGRAAGGGLAQGVMGRIFRNTTPRRRRAKMSPALCGQKIWPEKAGLFSSVRASLRAVDPESHSPLNC